MIPLTESTLTATAPIKKTASLFQSLLSAHVSIEYILVLAWSVASILAVGALSISAITVAQIILFCAVCLSLVLIVHDVGGHRVCSAHRATYTA